MSNHITTRASSTAKRSVWTEPREQLDGKSAMDHLYARLDGIYVGRWRQQFPGPSQVENWTQVWADAFVEEGITPEEVKSGLLACRRKYDWPPSLTEFLKACRPPIDPETAYYEACQQMAVRRNPVVRDGTKVADDRWSHPAVFWAASAMGLDLNLGYQNVKARWGLALAEALKDPKPVPEFREALPPPERCAVPPEVARARIAEITAGLMQDSRGMVKRSKPLSAADEDAARRQHAFDVEEMKARLERQEVAHNQG